MPQISLKILPGPFAIHRFPTDREIPPQVFGSSFVTISKTEDELSIVCDSEIDLGSEAMVDQWSCFKVLGPLDFSLIGLLAGISSCLAQSNISIFVVSTFETDYILVKSESLKAARRALVSSEYSVFD